MNYRYYKIGICNNEFDKGLSHFVKDDKNFYKVLSSVSNKFKINIYQKYTKMGFFSTKGFNYTIVVVEDDKIDKNSVNLVLNKYLNKISMFTDKFSIANAFLTFVIFKTPKMNDALMKYIKLGFNFKIKGWRVASSYAIIPVVYEEDEESLYIGCSLGNRLNSKWYSKEMIIWILENIHKNNIEFNKITLVKS